MPRLCLAVTAVLLVVTSVAVADTSTDWPRWRGPNDNGGAVSGSYPASFDATKHVAWKVALPGKGCSTPIVQDERVIVTAPMDGLDAVLALIAFVRS